MDNRKQSRFEAIIAGIALVIILSLIFLFEKPQEPEVVIAAHSDLYDMNYNPSVYEIYPNADYYDARAKKVKYLNIHCTASTRDLDKEWLLNFFKNVRGWSKPGYNLVVRFDGSIDTLASYDDDGLVQWDEISYGVRGRNSESINVSYTGGIDSKGKAKDTRTAQQKKTLQFIVDDIRCKFPWIQVQGHRDHGVPKECPSFNALGEYKSISPNYDLFDGPDDSIDID